MPFFRGTSWIYGPSVTYIVLFSSGLHPSKISTMEIPSEPTDSTRTSQTMIYLFIISITFVLMNEQFFLLWITHLWCVVEYVNCKSFDFISTAEIVHNIRDSPFSLSTNGSLDRGAQEQNYPVIVCFSDGDANRIISALLEIGVRKETSTGKHIFELLDDILTKNNIPWKNIISFSSDNADVMMGSQYGVAAKSSICGRVRLTALTS